MSSRRNTNTTNKINNKKIKNNKTDIENRGIRNRDEFQEEKSEIFDYEEFVRNYPESQPSLCIPHVFTTISKNEIFNIFKRLNLGYIHRIDIIHKYVLNENTYNIGFIHFKYWFNNEKALYAKERLNNGLDLKFIFDFPYFWKINIYQPSRTSSYNSQSKREVQPLKKQNNIIEVTERNCNYSKRERIEDTNNENSHSNDIENECETENENIENNR